jgi:hypothetical protein
VLDKTAPFKLYNTSHGFLQTGEGAKPTESVESVTFLSLSALAQVNHLSIVLNSVIIWFVPVKRSIGQATCRESKKLRANILLMTTTNCRALIN